MPWELPRDLDTPALVVDLDRLEANVASMAAHAAACHVELRPHAKTHKSIEIARRQLDAGAVGLTVATVGEAEVFSAVGVDDLFIAYPLVAAGPKAQRLRVLRDRARVRVGVASPAGAARLADALGPRSGLEVLLELDAGHHRTGVGIEEAPALARAGADAGLEVVGVFTHPGHAYAGPGAVAGAASDEARTLAEAAIRLTAAGFEPLVLSGGSTPTTRALAPGTPAPSAPGTWVHEQRPGSYVFNDRVQCALGAAGPEEVALVVASTVVASGPGGRFVCDAGSKALGAERLDYVTGFAAVAAEQGRAGPAEPAAVLTRLSEHHGMAGTVGNPPVVGEVVALVPNHVCPVVDHFDHFVVVRAGQVVDHWPVDARGRLG
ncbi:MAG TPA: alanine racemase [Acidimicrobiales bacterium]|nr:alanine racemase [Acidimicrobiales bacterium]